MQLQKIDKARYRKHLNIVIVTSILTLAISSLAIAQGLIHLYPDESGSHFHWNLLGVVAGCLIVGLTLSRVKLHDFMREVYYVWQLKQVLNQIQRKLAKVKKAVEQDDVNAMIVLNYYYQACRHLWQLDDNTITLDDLGVWQTTLDSKAEALNLNLKMEDFDLALLQQY
ncbi:DUF3087 domain-containing protein [Catenovulum maritimum]|uniref:DUF3087 domain-containing protein n=1 Tax=Catenovulum maritimum TaxID=1513271 RepID=A0A0J8GXW9_9ALTE|nr:DUF3087 domain-containing protein [Catenovulum maritimum]KMT66074.1 hypothetical protein XM47_06420 [Catenovulum maritimum]